MAKVSFTKLKCKVETSITHIEWEGETIEVKQYLPIQEKLALIGRVIMQAHEQDENYSNPVKVDVFRGLEMIFAYTNISFTDKQKEDLPKLYDMIDAVIENHSMRVQTGVLNEIMTEAVALQQPPSDKGKRLKLYYITQVSVKPPTFVIFVNDKELMHFSYTRYIENRIRDAFGFRGTPLRFIIRERKDK